MPLWFRSCHTKSPIVPHSGTVKSISQSNPSERFGPIVAVRTCVIEKGPFTAHGTSATAAANGLPLADRGPVVQTDAPEVPKDVLVGSTNPTKVAFTAPDDLVPPTKLSILPPTALNGAGKSVSVSLTVKISEEPPTTEVWRSIVAFDGSPMRGFDWPMTTLT